jgi:FAD/FMN-containing dehydrogenase
MQAFFANQSCDPFLAESRPCTLGNYAAYAVKVSNANQVAAAVRFANDHNIRLVVRNTGHEYVLLHFPLGSTNNDTVTLAALLALALSPSGLTS